MDPKGLPAGLTGVRDAAQTADPLEASKTQVPACWGVTWIR